MATSNIGPMMQATLEKYGLGSMAAWLSGKITSGASMDEIMLDLFNQPEFKAAFPEIEARRKKAQDTGLVQAPISPEDILNYRAQARTMMINYGLPPEFYSQNADFFGLIVGDISLDELNNRLQSVQKRIVTAPPEVRTAFGELYGDNADRALYAFAVDPDKASPALERMIMEAEVGGAGARFGFDLNVEQMSRAAGYGVDYGQAAQGFSSLAERSGLLDESIYEDVDLNLDTGIEAIFGMNAEASKALQRRADERTASTQGAAGGLNEQRGATGLGGAGRL
jgi:hypothetical protein